jgi:hypothetical protein
MTFANLPFVFAAFFAAVQPVAHAQMWGDKKESTSEQPPHKEPQSSPKTEPEITLFPGGLPVDVGEIPEGLANITAQGCNACHFQAHDDWKESAHAKAGQSAHFQEAIRRAGNSTACTQCHRPLLVQHAKLAAGYIDGDLSRPRLLDNPAFDATLMAEGVGCAACHVRQGTIVSTRTITGAPHPVTQSPDLSKSTLCATCHQLSYPDSDRPFYDTFGEWSATAHAAAGIQCQDCHMPPRPGVATASRFAASPDHRVVASLARALTVLVDLKNDQLHRGQATTVGLRVQNTGAAHHVPTGSPYKKLSFVVAIVDDKGVDLATSAPEILGRTLSEQPPYTTQADNRIVSGGEHTFSVELTVSHRAKAGKVSLVVRGTQGGDPTVDLAAIPMELN